MVSSQKEVARAPFSTREVNSRASPRRSGALRPPVRFHVFRESLS